LWIFADAQVAADRLWDGYPGKKKNQEKKNPETLVLPMTSNLKMAIANYDLHDAQKKRKRHVAEWAECDEHLSRVAIRDECDVVIEVETVRL
jgi:hypothetical protein